MASKFQNRLVGAVVLVAVGVIFLPTLLDGDKKYNEDQFAAIPLVPKPGDEQDIESIAPIEQTTTPSTPSEGASEAMISEAVTGIEAQQPSSTTNTPNIEQQIPVTAPPPVDTKKPTQPTEINTPKPAQPPVEETKPQPPKGEAWVIQLGVLTNKANVDQIVAKLHISGYPVYTKPTKIKDKPATLIYIGPSADKAELQAIIPHLKELTELDGKLKAYNP